MELYLSVTVAESPMKTVVKLLRETDREVDKTDALPLLKSGSNGCSPAPTPTPPPLLPGEENNANIITTTTGSNSPSAVVVEELPNIISTLDGTEIPDTHESSPQSQQQPPAAQMTVVIQEPTPFGGPRFRDTPLVLVDSDGVPFTTELRYVNGLFAWIIVGISCVIASWCCCPCLGLIPLCIKGLKDIEHINPDTGRVVGKYDKIASFGL